jgi:hypothetical protein
MLSQVEEAIEVLKQHNAMPADADAPAAAEE